MSHVDAANDIDKTALDAHFEKAAQNYEKDGGGVQSALCRSLLTFASEANHPTTKSSVVLDNAAGPGILTGELLKQVPASEIPELHAADFSAAMIRVLNAKGWEEQYGVQAAIMDAQDLRYQDEKFTHIFMNLGIFALPDPVKGTKEIFRTLKPGGIALVTTIRHAGWVPPFQKAQKRVRPDLEEFQGMLAPEWAKPEKIRGLLEKGGFEASRIEVKEASAEMDFVQFANTQQGIAKMASAHIVKGDWTEDEIAKFDEALREEIEIEKNSGSRRYIDVWVGIATK